MHRPAPLPHILVKSNIIGQKADLFDKYDDIVQSFPSLGIYGTEVAISIVGEADSDAAQLRRLTEWAKRWHDAGLHVFVHPYTSGAANPAECAEVDGGVPLDCLRRVIDTVARFAEQTSEKIVLTYHAAEHSGQTFGSDEAKAREGLRRLLLERSVRFFDLGFHYCEAVDPRVLLVSETQLPTELESPRIRIGDRPDEVLSTLSGRASGVCWDSGHYILSGEIVGISPEPTEEFVGAVTHMHIHDVIDSVDHRPLSPASRRVAQYVGLAAATGGLNSITLEYDYRLDKEAIGETESEQILSHLRKAVGLVRGWCGADSVDEG